jgi:hypothetical protein
MELPRRPGQQLGGGREVTDNEDRLVRPFAAWLQEQSNGLSHTQLSNNLHDLIGRVRETGKKGSMLYTVTISPYDKTTDVLQVNDTIRLKLPEHDRRSSIFFPDSNGNLTRQDPNQLAFDLRSVDTPDTTVISETRRNA